MVFNLLSKSFIKPVASRSFMTSQIKLSKPYYYTKAHDWAQFKPDSDNVARMGITWHAADELGELSYIALDELELNETIEAKDVLCDIESVKAAQTLNMPVTVKILAINEDLVDEPTILNRSPKTDGWLIEMEVENPDDVKELMTHAEYEELVGSERA